jgi:hypothetical protein
MGNKDRFSLRTAARALTATDESYSVYRKAVELFYLQGWAFAPSIADRRAAQRLATVKMLELIQEQNSPAQPKLKALVSNADFREMFDLFLEVGGWKGLRHTKAVKVFDETLQQGVADSRFAADVIDFSIRYDPAQASPRHNGGSTMARSIIVNAPSYKIDVGPTKLQRYWVQYKKRAICAYLLHRQGYDQIRPRLVCKTNFASRLLDDVKRVDDWREFFRAYGLVAAKLASRGYSYEDLRSIVGDGPVDLKIDPFPGDVREEVTTYRRRDPGR